MHGRSRRSSHSCIPSGRDEVPQSSFLERFDVPRVNPFPWEYAGADQDELEQDIRSTGFYRNKAKNIIACCKALLEKHGGSVPGTMEELVLLPGVGRKTANCVLGAVYGANEGVVVDTHVRRVAQRLGLTKNDDPVRIEMDLMEIIPREEWFVFGNRLIWHGRRVCDAKKPRCLECVLRPHCPSAEDFITRKK